MKTKKNRRKNIKKILNTPQDREKLLEMFRRGLKTIQKWD